MSVMGRGLDSLTFLPEAVRDALRRRLRELGGLALLALAAVLAVALATWSVQDPSLSHATNAPVRNMLGVSGAIVADLLIQLLGVASLALVVPVAIWGWRLATHRPMQRERFRLLFWLLAFCTIIVVHELLLGLLHLARRRGRNLRNLIIIGEGA